MRRKRTLPVSSGDGRRRTGVRRLQGDGPPVGQHLRAPWVSTGTTGSSRLPLPPTRNRQVAITFTSRFGADIGPKSREVIWGGQILGATIRAKHAREEAAQAIRDADRAEAQAW